MLPVIQLSENGELISSGVDLSITLQLRLGIVPTST